MRFSLLLFSSFPLTFAFSPQAHSHLLSSRCSVTEILISPIFVFEFRHDAAESFFRPTIFLTFLSSRFPPLWRSFLLHRPLLLAPAYSRVLLKIFFLDKESNTLPPMLLVLEAKKELLRHKQTFLIAVSTSFLFPFLEIGGYCTTVAELLSGRRFLHLEKILPQPFFCFLPESLRKFSHPPDSYQIIVARL